MIDSRHLFAFLFILLTSPIYTRGVLFSHPSNHSIGLLSSEIESHFINSYGVTISPTNELYVVFNEFYKSINYLRVIHSDSKYLWNLTAETIAISNANFSIYGEPSILIKNGTLWVSTLFSQGTQQGLIVLKKPLAGISWQTAFILNTSSFEIRDVKIKPFPSQSFFALFWSDNHLGNYALYARFYNISSQLWSSVYAVSNENSFNCFESDVYIDENATAHFVWTEESLTREQILYRAIALNGSVRSIEQLTSGATWCREPKIVGREDQLTVFWTNYTVENPGLDYGTINIQMSTKVSNGSWSSPYKVAPFFSIEQPAENSDAKSPTVSFDLFGKLWLAYEIREVYLNHMGIDLRGKDNSGWQRSERVSLKLNPAIAPKIRGDLIGNLHCFWLDFRSGNYQLYYRTRFLDGLWSSEIALTSFHIEAGEFKNYFLLFFGAITLIVLPVVIVSVLRARKEKKLLQKKIDSLQD